MKYTQNQRNVHYVTTKHLPKFKHMLVIQKKCETNGTSIQRNVGQHIANEAQKPTKTTKAESQRKSHEQTPQLATRNECHDTLTATQQNDATPHRNTEIQWKDKTRS